MRTPTLVALAAVTALAVGTAAVELHRRGPVRVTAAAGEPVFPAIAGKPEAVAQIVVTRPEGSFTLARKGDGWILPDHGDYPVRADDAKRAVDSFAAMRLSEPKTARPELYARLELDDPTKPGAKATLVTLKGADGKELGKVILGKPRAESLDNGAPGIYLRRPPDQGGGDQHAWLALGDPRIKPTVADWIDRSVVDIKVDRIREVATIAPDRSRLVVSRDKPADKDFKIYGQPEGTKVKSQYTVNDLASALDPLTLDDVQGATSVAFPASGNNQAEFRTFDGLVLRVSLAEDKGATWLRVEAMTEPARKDENNQSTVVEPTDAVKKEADDLNARLRNYVFRVSDTVAKKLTSRLADLTEKDDKKEEKKS